MRIVDYLFENYNLDFSYLLANKHITIDIIKKIIEEYNYRGDKLINNPGLNLEIIKYLDEKYIYYNFQLIKLDRSIIDYLSNKREFWTINFNNKFDLDTLKYFINEYPKHRDIRALSRLFLPADCQKFLADNFTNLLDWIAFSFNLMDKESIIYIIGKYSGYIVWNNLNYYHMDVDVKNYLFDIYEKFINEDILLGNNDIILVKKVINKYGLTGRIKNIIIDNSTIDILKYLIVNYDIDWNYYVERGRYFTEISDILYEKMMIREVCHPSKKIMYENKKININMNTMIKHGESFKNNRILLNNLMDMNIFKNYIGLNIIKDRKEKKFYILEKKFGEYSNKFMIMNRIFPNEISKLIIYYTQKIDK